MCNCPAHHELVDCDGCHCDHGNERMLQWKSRALAVETELARLRAGESDEPAAEGTELTAGQWIRRWNDETAEGRLQRVTHIRTAFRAWRECEEADHHGRLEHLDTELTNAQSKLAQLRAYAAWCKDRDVEADERDILAIVDGHEHHDYVVLMKRAAQ